jgi:hypothetical protein
MTWVWTFYFAPFSHMVPGMREQFFFFLINFSFPINKIYFPFQLWSFFKLMENQLI